VQTKVQANPDEKQSVTMSITGMTCAACATRIEKNLSKIEGVQKANVNLATEKATVSYDPAITSVENMIEKVKKTGYGVQEEKVQLDIIGMTCAACVTRVEKGVNKIDGVTNAAVNLASEKASVDFIPGQTNMDQIIAMIKKDGYDAKVIGDTNEDYERNARESAYKKMKTKFIIGAVLSSLFLIQMVSEISINFGNGEFVFLLNPWLQLLLATPVQFYVGGHYYRDAYNAVRGFSANMAVLVVLGTS